MREAHLLTSVVEYIEWIAYFQAQSSEATYFGKMSELLNEMLQHINIQSSNITLSIKIQ